MTNIEDSLRWDARMRAHIEQILKNWAHTVTKYRWVVILSCLLFAIGLSSFATQLRVETSTEAFLLADDPVRLAYDDFREQFGIDETIILEIVPPKVFSFAFLEKLRAFHNEIEETAPHIEEITSLINVRETVGEGDQLIVRDFLENWPETEEDLARVEQAARNNSLYTNYLLSESGHVTAVRVLASTFSGLETEIDDFSAFDETMASDEQTDAKESKTFLTGAESRELMQALDEIAARFESEDFQIHFAGGPVINDRMSVTMANDMRLFLLLSLLVISVLLYALFRRAAAVFLPLTVIMLTVSSTVGAMGLTKIPIGVATQIMPSFLMSVGVGATVHLLVVFFQAYDRGEPREEALAYALGHSGLAVIMTSLTTAGGLVSFVVAEVSPVAVLGIFTPVGIILGLAYTMLLMPALLAVVPLVRRDPKGSKAVGTRVTERCMLWIGDRCVDHSWLVIICMSCVLLVSFVGMTKLKFEYDPIHWFPPEHKVRTDIEHVDENLGGAHSLEVLVDTGRENGLLEPELLNNFEKIAYRMAVLKGDGGGQIVKTVSINQVLKETHQALNSNNPEYYVIPQDRKLIAQELLLFENSGTDDLEELVDSNFQLARFTLKLPYIPPAYLHKFFPEVLDQFKQVLGDEVEIIGTGNVALIARSMDVLRRSLTKSYGIALLIITPLMILLLGSFRAGLTAMVPNLSPIICTLGLMGWFGIPLDPFTLLIGSIAIGLAVDDTIHFMHNFRKYFEEFGNSKRAVRETLRTTGAALLMTSVVLSLGFFIYIFSTLDNLTFFGLLTGFTIITAFLADVTISPAVMTLFMRYNDRERPEERPSQGE